MVMHKTNNCVRDRIDLFDENKSCTQYSAHHDKFYTVDVFIDLRQAFHSMLNI